MHAQVGHKRRTAWDLLQSLLCASAPILVSILPGQACPRLCALLVHLLSVVRRQGATSSPTDRPRPKKHTSVRGAGRHSLLPPEPRVSVRLRARTPVGAKPVEVEASVTGRPGAPGEQVPLELWERSRAGERFRKQRGRNWLNRENSCVNFCTKISLATLVSEGVLETLFELLSLQLNPSWVLFLLCFYSQARGKLTRGKHCLCG